MKRKLILSAIGDDEGIDLYNDAGVRLVSTVGIGFGADVGVTELYDYDGSMFQGSRLRQRGISLVVRYIGARWLHEAHKGRLLRLLGNKGEIRLRYVTDRLDVYIDCRTEQADTPPNTYPMVTQISLVCPDPYWRTSGDNTVMLAGTISCWEFPFEIPPEGMEFGRIKAELITEVYNGGSADSGAVWTITANTPCSNPKIENIVTGEFMQVACEMQRGDVLEICTEQGKKSIMFTRGEVTQNYFNYRVNGFSFLGVARGLNIFKYTLDDGDEHAVDITCRFDKKYGGI